MAVAAATRRPRARRVISALLLVSITLFVVDQAGESAPTHQVRSIVRDAFASVGSTLQSLWPFEEGNEVHALQRQNQQLQSQIDAMQGQIAVAAEVERERKTLAGLLNLSTPGDIPKVVARVTAIGASNFDATIELGKGSDAGIAVGMPVVTEKGLIGRVVQTSRTRATVLLITDTTSNVGVRFPSGDIGVIVGQGMRQNLRTDLIDLNTQIKVGDVAVTNGMDHSLFPPGIPIGTVKSVTAGPRDLRKDVRITPFAEWNKLDEVAVLQWKP